MCPSPVLMMQEMLPEYGESSQVKLTVIFSKTKHVSVTTSCRPVTYNAKIQCHCLSTFLTALIRFHFLRAGRLQNRANTAANSSVLVM